MKDRKPSEKMTRRDFSMRLAVAGGGLFLLAGFRGRPAAPRAPSGPKVPPFVEGIEARLEGDVLYLSSRSAGRLKVPPAGATFITAIHLASQRPLCCRPLAGASGLTVAGPFPGKAGVSYHAKVRLAALMDLAKGFEILVHASFWQYRSGVLFFRVEA